MLSDKLNVWCTHVYSAVHVREVEENESETGKKGLGISGVDQFRCRRKRLQETIEVKSDCTAPIQETRNPALFSVK